MPFSITPGAHPQEPEIGCHRSIRCDPRGARLQPDVLEKIREGKVQAAGAVIGDLTKAMKCTADAARLRELVLERTGI